MKRQDKLIIGMILTVLFVGLVFVQTPQAVLTYSSIEALMNKIVDASGDDASFRVEIANSVGDYAVVGDFTFNAATADKNSTFGTDNDAGTLRTDGGDDAVKFGAFVDYDLASIATQSYSISSTSKASRFISAYSATGASTVHLMSNLVVAGRELVIVDGGGNSDPNNIVLDTEGAETINGGATYTVATDYKQIRCLSDGTNWLCY